MRPARWRPVCPECGYSLRGLTGPRCPECGHDFPADVTRFRRWAVRRLPWDRRRRPLLTIAYLETLLLILVLPCRAGRALAVPDRWGRALRWAAAHLLLAALAATLLGNHQYFVRWLIGYVRPDPLSYLGWYMDEPAPADRVAVWAVESFIAWLFVLCSLVAIGALLSAAVPGRHRAAKRAGVKWSLYATPVLLLSLAALHGWLFVWLRSVQSPFGPPYYYEVAPPPVLFGLLANAYFFWWAWGIASCPYNRVRGSADWSHLRARFRNDADARPCRLSARRIGGSPVNSVLERHSQDSRRREFVRLGIGVSLAAVMGLAGYAVRPSLVRWAAERSVGCPGREDLLASALRQDDRDFHDDSEQVSKSRRWRWSRRLDNLRTHSLPRPGWIRGPADLAESRDTDATFEFFWRGIGYADGRLRRRGALIWPSRELAAPADTDGDERWELLLSDDASTYEDDRSIKRYVVVRLGESNNEIVWIGLSDYWAWKRRGARIKPIWRDEDGDSVEELVFETIATVRLPGGRLGFRPLETVAVFAWDRPGGVLRPRALPDGDEMLIWEPPETGPVQVPQNADLAPILESLLPLPDDFGEPPPPPTTAPAPSSSP